MILELRVIIPGQDERVIPLSVSRLLIGSLLSNQIVLRADGVEPIHALIEQVPESEQWVVIDLFSPDGIQLNGKKVDVEASIKSGDTIQIGSVKISVMKATIPEDFMSPAMGETQLRTNPYATQKNAAAKAVSAEDDLVDMDALSDHRPISRVSKTVELPAEVPEQAEAVDMEASEDSENKSPQQSSKKDERLFSPRHAQPHGNVLEVVAFWGDTVLEVDHFHPQLKGHEKALIGESETAHFISAGDEKISAYPLAEAADGNYQLNLLPGMTARIRKEGRVGKIEGQKKISMGKRDLAYVSYGPVNYFMMNIRPPRLILPNQGTKDPFLVMLMMLFFVAYLFMIVPIVLIGKVDIDKNKEDDPWAIVNLPEEQLKQLEAKVPKPKIEQKLAEVKIVPKTPPKPKVEPFKPAKPVEKEKPEQAKPVQRPAAKDIKVDQNPSEVAKTQGAKTPQQQKPDEGMPSTGAKNPDFKLAGRDNGGPKGAAGGVKGAGNNEMGGRRKGTGTADYKGVEGVKNNQASGVNLSKLGLGAGMVRDITGPGAVSVPFRNSAGGAGGGMGSASKTYGLGGTGDSRSVGLAGAGSGLNNFGSGAGGFGSGQGGQGGLGGAGMGRGKGDGRGRANVIIPPGDPVSSGGLTSQEIMAVIRANLNQIRHCYEQLLQRSPGVSGQVKVKFVVSLSGSVSSADIMSSSISDSTMQNCITSKIERWDFPTPRGGQPVTITYPFSFTPL